MQQTLAYKENAELDSSRDINKNRFVRNYCNGSGGGRPWYKTGLRSKHCLDRGPTAQQQSWGGRWEITKTTHQEQKGFQLNRSKRVLVEGEQRKNLMSSQGWWSKSFSLTWLDKVLARTGRYRSDTRTPKSRPRGLRGAWLKFSRPIRVWRKRNEIILSVDIVNSFEAETHYQLSNEKWSLKHPIGFDKVNIDLNKPYKQISLWDPPSPYKENHHRDKCNVKYAQPW